MAVTDNSADVEPETETMPRHFEETGFGQMVQILLDDLVLPNELFEFYRTPTVRTEKVRGETYSYITDKYGLVKFYLGSDEEDYPNGIPFERTEDYGEYAQRWESGQRHVDVHSLKARIKQNAEHHEEIYA